MDRDAMLNELLDWSDRIEREIAAWQVRSMGGDEPVLEHILRRIQLPVERLRRYAMLQAGLMADIELEGGVTCSGLA